MRLSHRDTSVMYLWTLLFISSFSCTAVSNSIEISCESAKQKEPVLALVTSNTSFGVEETRGKRLLCYFHVSLWLTLARARVCVVCALVYKWKTHVHRWRAKEDARRPSSPLSPYPPEQALHWKWSSPFQRGWLANKLLRADVYDLKLWVTGSHARLLCENRGFEL